MCAYFFAVSRPAVAADDADQKKLLALKEVVTNPAMLELVRKQTDADRYKFSIENSEHIALVEHCTKTVTQKLEDVTAADKEAATFFILGMTAQALLPFGWVISPLALMYSGYMIKERESAYADYNAALKTAKNCASWALKDEVTGNIENPAVSDMLKTLLEVMTYEQLDGIILDGQDENVFYAKNLLKEKLITTDQLASLTNTGNATRPDWLKAAMKTSDEIKQKTLKYKMYGYEQGGSLPEIAVKIMSFIREAFSSLLVQGMDLVRNSAPSAK